MVMLLPRFQTRSKILRFVCSVMVHDIHLKDSPGIGVLTP